MIVGSILLAFGIDAWWEGRGERDEATDYLIALRGELEATRDELLGDQETRQGNLAAIQSLLDATADVADLTEDSVSALLQTIWGTPRLNPPSALYQDLTTTGNRDLIRSDDLRFALVEYGQRLARFEWQEEAYQVAWESELRPYLVANTDMLVHVRRSNVISDEWLPAPTYDSGFDGIMRDRTFQNVLIVVLRRLAVVMTNSVGLMRSLDEVLTLIDEQVD